MVDQIDFASLMGPVARRLLGEPNSALSNDKKLRFRSRGSLAIDLEKGAWFDHESDEGGGTLDLIKYIQHCQQPEAMEWLRHEGFINGQHQKPHSNGGVGQARPKFKLAATYQYHDENGELLFEVVRLDPKDFRQRRPDGNGNWLWGLDAGEYMRPSPGKDWLKFNEKKFSGWPVSKQRKEFSDTRRTLYKLPELIEATASDHPVMIVEGEKDVEALYKLGFPATTNPQGVGKWRNEYNDFLRDARIAIIPDNDDPGRKHAESVAVSLQGIASQVKIVELPNLPPKGDVSDWIATASNFDGALHDLILKTPEWRPPGWQRHTTTAAELQHMRFAELAYVVPTLIPEGLTILAGRPKVGKSWLALDCCLGVGGDKAVLGGINPLHGDVLYCALEDTRRRLQRRITKLVSPLSTMWPERLTLATQWRRLDQGGVDDVRAWAQGVPEPRLVVLDTLAGVRPNRTNAEQLYDSDYRALIDLHHLAGELGIAVLVLHHTRKMEADDPLDTV
jgi:5S rRNA maturation endonuclease (ribonuclease M5)